MLPWGSKKQKTAAETDAVDIAQLPSDVLPGIFLCLSASDLRRFRRVCKEWRDVISDPSFTDAHMVHGPHAPTHTIVFYPGRPRRADASDDESHSVGGFLFDEQWRLTARFTVDESAEMIGTCKGLLCFRDSVRGIIKVVDPFTGDSIALPLPPTDDAGTCSTAAYCFGFDATARRYKIVHAVFQGKVEYDGYFFPASTKSSFDARMRSAGKQELRVFTVGTDTEWRTMRISSARHGMLYGDPACDDGAVYWYSQGYHDGYYRNVRFDLATERIRSEHRRLVDGEITCRYLPLRGTLHTIGIRWFGDLDSEDRRWSKHIDAVPHETYDVARRSGYFLAGPHALQRGHLLLRCQQDGALRAYRIESSGVSTLDACYHWFAKTLVEIGGVEKEPAEPYKFVTVNRRCLDSSKVEAPITGRLPSKERAITISTFAYVPTLSAAPFAHSLKH